MPYEFLEDIATADIAFRATGETLEEVFIAAADATMNAMIENLERIEAREKQLLALKNDQLDMLLFDFLQEIIYYKDASRLLLRCKDVAIQEKEGEYTLKTEAAGEELDPQRHQQRVDVKAVTLHRFELKQTDNGWEAVVILDI